MTMNARTLTSAPTTDPSYRKAAERADHTATSFGTFRLDPSRRLLSNDGELVRIGSRALDVLIVLTDRAGEVVSGHELVRLAWRGAVVEEAGVRVHIASLRRALGDGRDGARYILNVCGRGYSFVAPVTRELPDAQSQRPASQPVRSMGRVPPLPRSLIGRTHVVDSLSKLILERQLISIVGSGGIGKTTVAAAIVERLHAEFGDEDVAFVDFGAVSEPDQVPGAVVSALGCRPGGTDPIAEILNFVSEKRMLIVFDSCEHLVDATSALAARLYQYAPNVHLLVTSREALRLEGEIVHLLSPLTCPDNECPNAAEAQATSAVQLFMNRATFSGFNGELSDLEAPVVSDICRRADGIALAIELAASRVGTYGIRGVADLLARNADLRLAGRRNAPLRHQTLEAMLDWSFTLLDEDEQRVLARLSTFVGLFTMEAACSIAGEEEHNKAEVSATVARLVDKSLVWVHPLAETFFYRLPDTTRAYAAAKLEEAGESEPVAQRHASYFASLFKSLALKHDAYADIRRHASHVGNVRKALEWSFSHEKCRTTGIELAADTAPLFLGLWLLAEGRHWSLTALSKIEDTSEIPHEEARLQEALAVSAMHTLGNTPEVRSAIDRGLDLSEACGQGLPQLRLLAGLNLFLTRLGDFEGGLVAAKRCAVIAERSDSLGDRAIAEWLLAAAYHLAGDQDAAVAHYELGSKLEATIGRREINLFGYDHHLRGKIALARSVWLRGAPESSCRLVLEAMDEASRISPPSNYSMAAAHCVPVLLWSGNTEDTAEHIERLLQHAERHALKSHSAAAWALRGEWLLMTGEPSAGVETLRQALKKLYCEQLYMIIPAASRALAEGLSRCARHDEALTTVEAAISSAREKGQHFYLPDLLRTKGEIILKGLFPDFTAAEFAFRESIELAKGQRAVGWELKAAVPLANLLIEQGRIDEAASLITPIYEAHTEKHGTKDLVLAASILTIAQCRPSIRPDRRANLAIRAVHRFDSASSARDEGAAE